MLKEEINKQKKSTKTSVERMEEIFHSTNPYAKTKQNIIRDYVYIPEKRII